MVTDLGKRASVYALDHDNQELHDHLRTSKGALSNMPDTVSLAKAKDMYTRMEAIKRDLADYGITEEILDKCKRLIDAYDAYITRPRDLIVERKGHNQSLSELLRDLRRCVYKLDSLMSLFLVFLIGLPAQLNRALTFPHAEPKRTMSPRCSVPCCTMTVATGPLPSKIGRASLGKECRSRWSPYH